MGRTLYDENLRVPLIMVLPAKLPPGTRIESQVRTIDIMPTILSILGIPLQHEVQGRDLTPLVTGARDFALDALAESVYEVEFNSTRSLRSEGFKIITDVGAESCAWTRTPLWCARWSVSNWWRPTPSAELYTSKRMPGS